MKQSLQMRMGQQMTMTPQLQQSIKLLQLSTLDLQQEIQQVLDSNMMLEVVDENEIDPNEPILKKIDTHVELSSEGSQTEIPDELPVDFNWADVYEEALATCSSSMQTEELDFEFESQSTKFYSLHEHLQAQLEMALFSAKDMAIASAIVDSINEEGYLIAPIETIYQDLLDDLEDLDIEEVLAVLHSIQNFEPAGIAALDLSESLTLQLLQLPETTAYREQAICLVKKHLPLLAAHDQDKLLLELAVSAAELEQIIALVRQLNPRPGSSLKDIEAQYIVPDVYVVKREGQWLVTLNSDATPRLRINPFYAGLINQLNNEKDSLSMKTHLQEAKWFIKSLHGRNDTLLQVAQCIIEKQIGFLEHGAIAMKAMVLKDIAEELELHESTISRLTTQKYMHTPNGIVEFKYFFSSHVSTTEGGECSATAIRAFIKELISTEQPTKPLSDGKIALLLQEKGINVARRTIAKYREALSIAASSQRKRLL